MANASTAGWDSVPVETFQTKNNAWIAEFTGKSIDAVQKRRARLIRAGALEATISDVFEEIRGSHDLKNLKGDIALRDKEIVRLQQELEIAQRIDASVRRPPEWTARPRSTKSRTGIVCAQLTDTHFDEVVRPEEVGGYNAYNRAIAEKRLKRWAEKVIVLARDFVKGVEIEGLFIPATGDLLSGDIHQELRESNEDHLYASAEHWIDQLIGAIKVLAKEFGRVHIGAVVGNHGRSTVKPVYKGRAKSNIEWLMWRQIARYFNDEPKVTVQVSDSMDLIVPIYQTRYLLTHGDQYRGGTGISGAMAPLMLGQHRKTVRQMAMGDPMDIQVLGHWHQYLTLPGVIMGGSMKGLDEFAYGINVRPERPQQAFWVSSPEHGPTIHAPVHVSKRSEEGW